MNIKTKIPQLSLRKIVESDVALMLSFIRELAEYEKLRHEVTATEESLRESFFGKQKVAEALIAQWDGRPVGYAIFFHNFSTFLGRRGMYLEDIYVKPEMRGKGIGGVLLSYLAKLAVKRGCGRIEWIVLDWNKSAIRLYRFIGAVPMDDWTIQRVSDSALKRLADSF
jgi:GNAT superfamily N-acetyltransferase